MSERNPVSSCGQVSGKEKRSRTYPDLAGRSLTTSSGTVLKGLPHSQKAGCEKTEGINSVSSVRRLGLDYYHYKLWGHGHGVPRTSLEVCLYFLDVVYVQ